MYCLPPLFGMHNIQQYYFFQVTHSFISFITYTILECHNNFSYASNPPLEVMVCANVLVSARFAIQGWWQPPYVAIQEYDNAQTRLMHLSLHGEGIWASSFEGPRQKQGCKIRQVQWWPHTIHLLLKPNSIQGKVLPHAVGQFWAKAVLEARNTYTVHYSSHFVDVLRLLVEKLTDFGFLIQLFGPKYAFYRPYDFLLTCPCFFGLRTLDGGEKVIFQDHHPTSLTSSCVYESLSLLCHSGIYECLDVL